MGRYDEDKEDNSRRLRVILCSPAEAGAVLRVARNLKKHNQERKESYLRPLGIAPFLSKEELAVKKSLWGRWKQARDCKAPKTFWRSCRLLVEGEEVHPQGVHQLM